MLLLYKNMWMDFIYRAPWATIRHTPHCTTLDNNAAISHDIINGFVYDRSAIPYSPFERAATRPKLNAMRYRYGVGSNFLTGVPGEFEDLMTLRLCLNSKFNCPFCYISEEGFTRDDLPYQIRNDTAIRIRLSKLRPLLEAEYFHHKLNILLKAVIGCKTSSETRRNHD